MEIMRQYITTPLDWFLMSFLMGMLVVVAYYMIDCFRKIYGDKKSQHQDNDKDYWY